MENGEVFMAKWEIVLEIELVWLWSLNVVSYLLVGLNLGFKSLKLVIVGHCLVGFELKLWSLQAWVLWATTWWALKLKLWCLCLWATAWWALKPSSLSVVGHRLVSFELRLWVLKTSCCGLSLGLLNLKLWALKACGLSVWNLWAGTFEASGLVGLSFWSLWPCRACLWSLWVCEL